MVAEPSPVILVRVVTSILFLRAASHWQRHEPGDFEEALVALLGKDAGGLSASAIGFLVGRARWGKRDFSVTR